MNRFLPLFLSVTLWWAHAGAGVSTVPKVVDLQWLDKALAQSNALTVFEGLPHPFEGPVHAAEIKRVPTFEIGDQRVYARSLDVSADDRRKLAEVFGSKRVLIPPPVGGLPMKLCGGFHADYAIRWEKDDATLFYSLICFGCEELRLIEGDVAVTADMTKEGREALMKILLSYRQERPPFQAHKAGETPRAAPPPPKVEYQP